MSLTTLKDKLPNYAKDIKLNISSVLGKAHSGLSTEQIAGIALACAHAIGSQVLLTEINHYASDVLDEQHQLAAKSAGVMMAMNNIYYRAVHLLEDPNYLSMPAQLRMNAINNHGIEQADFELYSLAVSAINGCGMCLNAHNAVLIKASVSKESIQTALRIAAILNAAATALQTV